jgi:hypothetical protein
MQWKHALQKVFHSDAVALWPDRLHRVCYRFSFKCHHDGPMKKSVVLCCLSLLSLPAFAQNQMDTATAKQVLEVHAYLNEQCRGGPGDQPSTRVACDNREKLGKVLTKAGWCYGRPDQPSYMMDWHRCDAPTKTPAATIATTKTAATFDMNAAIATAVKNANLSPATRMVTGKADTMSYSLLVEYDRDINAAQDNYLLAASFVRYLVSVGRDPSAEKGKRGVHVCAQQAGLTTVSGKPGVRPLGCAHYNPFKDVITQD